RASMVLSRLRHRRYGDGAWRSVMSEGARLGMGNICSGGIRTAGSALLAAGWSAERRPHRMASRKHSGSCYKPPSDSPESADCEELLSGGCSDEGRYIPAGDTGRVSASVPQQSVHVFSMNLPEMFTYLSAYFSSESRCSSFPCSGRTRR